MENTENLILKNSSQKTLNLKFYQNILKYNLFNEEVVNTKFTI